MTEGFAYQTQIITHPLISSSPNSRYITGQCDTILHTAQQQSTGKCRVLVTYELTKYTPYLARTGAIWGVCCKKNGEKWSRDIESALCSNISRIHTLRNCINQRWNISILRFWVCPLIELHCSCYAHIDMIRCGVEIRTHPIFWSGQRVCQKFRINPINISEVIIRYVKTVCPTNSIQYGRISACFRINVQNDLTPVSREKNHCLYKSLKNVLIIDP